MSEYVQFQKTTYKCGTCENMYWLRADHVHLVKAGSVDPAKRAVQTWLLEDLEGRLHMDAEVFLNHKEALKAKQAVINAVVAEQGEDPDYVSAGLCVGECEGVMSVSEDGAKVSYHPAADTSVGFTRRADTEWASIPEADGDDAWTQAVEAAGWTGACNQTDALDQLVTEHFPDFGK